MGTRSTITFYRKDKDSTKETPYVRIYQQFDGYLEGVGMELLDWLDNKTLVNGISDYRDPDIANGLGCLIAQFIRDFKDEVGGLYIYPVTSDTSLIDYNYDVVYNPRGDIPGAIREANECFVIRVTYGWGDGQPFFIGTPEELREYILSRR